MIKQEILSSDLNLSAVISNSLNDQITEVDYLKLAVGYYLFDLVPKTRKEQTKQINFNDCSRLIENLMTAKFMQKIEMFNQMQNVKRSPTSKTKKDPSNSAHQSFSIRDPQKQQERNSYLLLGGRIKAYFCMNHIHRNLSHLKTLLMLVGNFFAQKQHIGLQKHFYSPELVSAVIEMKSNPYCRDIQFLAFTLLAAVPNNRRLEITSGGTQSRECPCSRRYC